MSDRFRRALKPPLPQRGQPVASRQPEGRDAWKRATRLSSGDRVIALETWFYPTVWPNPMLDTKYLGYEMNGFVENPLDQPGCNGTSVPPYMGPFVMMGERSWMAVNALTAPWQGKRPPPSMAFDRTLAQGMLNDFGYGLDVPGQGLAPFTFHPHQVISLLAVNVSELGLLSPTQPSSPSLSPPATAWWHAGSREETWDGGFPNGTSLYTMLWDGRTGHFGCRANGNGVPWNPSALTSPDSTLCLGGSSGPCQLHAEMCPIQLDHTLATPQQGDALSCGRPATLGSEMTTPELPVGIWAQAGYTGLQAWWKPCPGCNGEDGCDAEQCRKNLTRLLQRRVGRRGEPPSPEQLAELRRADGSAFPYYECWSTAFQGMLSALPQCVPVCADGAAAVPWVSLADAGAPSSADPTSAPLLPGAIPSRSWFMAWTGPRGNGSKAACVSASRVIGAASAGLFGASGSAKTAALGPSFQGVSSGAAAVLLSPWLSQADLSITLRVPILQLGRGPRAAFVMQVTSDIAASLGSTRVACLLVACEQCPDASNYSVWGQSPRDLAGPGAASDLVTLQLRVTFQPSCERKRPSSDASLSWMADARGALPVVFSGTGASADWAARHPDAAAARASWAARALSSPQESPVLRALSLQTALRRQDAWAVVGAWLVWAQPADQSGHSVGVRVRCVHDTWAAAVAVSEQGSLASLGTSCLQQGQGGLLASTGAVVSLLALLGLLTLAGVHQLRRQWVAASGCSEAVARVRPSPSAVQLAVPLGRLLRTVGAVCLFVALAPLGGFVEVAAGASAALSLAVAVLGLGLLFRGLWRRLSAHRAMRRWGQQLSPLMSLSEPGPARAAPRAAAAVVPNPQLLVVLASMGDAMCTSVVLEEAEEAAASAWLEEPSGEERDGATLPPAAAAAAATRPPQRSRWPSAAVPPLEGPSRAHSALRRARFRPKNPDMPRFSLGVAGSPRSVAGRVAGAQDASAPSGAHTPPAEGEEALFATRQAGVLVRVTDGPRPGEAGSRSALASGAQPGEARVGALGFGPGLPGRAQPVMLLPGVAGAELPPPAPQAGLAAERADSVDRATALPAGLLRARRWLLDAAIVADLFALACTVWVVLMLSVPAWQAWAVEPWALRAGAHFSQDVLAGAAHIVAPQVFEFCAIPAVVALLGSLPGPCAACASSFRAPMPDDDSLSESTVPAQQ